MASLSESVRGMVKDCKLCGDRVVCENPHLPGCFHEGSSNLEGWDICHDCMVDHCVTTNCLGCKYGEYPNCRFLEMKRHYMEED